MLIQNKPGDILYKINDYITTSEQKAKFYWDKVDLKLYQNGV